MVQNLIFSENGLWQNTRLGLLLADSENLLVLNWLKWANLAWPSSTSHGFKAWSIFMDRCWQLTPLFCWLLNTKEHFPSCSKKTRTRIGCKNANSTSHTRNCSCCCLSRLCCQLFWAREVYLNTIDVMLQLLSCNLKKIIL